MKGTRYREVGNVIYVRWTGHRRPLSLRAAKVASISVVNPKASAVGVAQIVDHHSQGTLLRCFHLRAANVPAPISPAIASGVGQSPITDLNESIFDMAPFLRQSVLQHKHKMSGDGKPLFWDNLGMGGNQADSEDNEAFIARTRQARMARFETQEPICKILRIEQALYGKYETRTPLPRRFYPLFCAATGISYEWFLTGEGDGPKQVVPLKPPRKARTPRKPRFNRAASG